MKASLLFLGALLCAGLSGSMASADSCTPCPPAPPCAPCPPAPPCTPCPEGAQNPCDPCSGIECCECPDPWWKKCHLFRGIFHHEPKCEKPAPAPKPAKQPPALNSPVFPTHPYLRSPRDFFMLD